MGTRKDTSARVEEVLGAWEKMRPEKSFFGMKLDDFKKRIQGFMDAKKEVADLEVQLAHAVSKREAASPLAMKAVRGVVSAVKGDPDEGEDGELYSAMGYVPQNQRSTGLKRPRKAEAANGSAE